MSLPNAETMDERGQPEWYWQPWFWGWAVTLFTFPLIWVGGLVTTHDAGMAVPDWPGTYGYNLFMYPVSAWLYGPFDLFIEHGHRLLGSFVGLLSIALCVAAWRVDARVWYRWACVGLLVAVICQGLLGGVRVVLDARTVAMLHGCGGPMVFALATFLALSASSDWKGRFPAFHFSGCDASHSHCWSVLRFSCILEPSFVTPFRTPLPLLSLGWFICT
jgi:heme a synthase